MAWPGPLTADQQNAVITTADNIRSWSAKLTALNELGIQIGAAWNGGVSTMVGSLQSGDLIPTHSSYAGAQQLVPADVTNLAGYAINSSDASAQTQGTGAYASAFILALCVKAAGINA